ncbi:phosphosulfolactate synthase [Geofilum sp. OHC36d9]|uniref:phosphosulfolactate synthase n=1 Tax=Geofilum sp. OHC36d9 TaxID=3458413 RepID=UPI004033B118
MNFNIDFLPQRPEKPRTNGLTIMTDKSLSVKEAENFTEGNVPYTDFVKMAFGTSLLIPSLESKLNIYREADIKPYFGGTLFEVFAYRKAMNDYFRYLDKYGIEYVEVSDGTIQISHEKKIEYIKQLNIDYDVISQATNFTINGFISFDTWLSKTQEELSAGAKFIIVKESIQLPVYGEEGLASYIAAYKMNEISIDQLIWDAPLKDQQIELINLFGNNVNLCNIAPEDIIPLETKRLGLHGSTLLKLIAPGTEENDTE